MDISNSLSFIVGILIAIAAGWLGWQEWSRASKAERIVIVRRVVLAIEQMNPNTPGAKKLDMVLGRLRDLLGFTDVKEVRELVESTVAEINLAKQSTQSRGLPRGYFTD
jgi:hypothetical protein